MKITKVHGSTKNYNMKCYNGASPNSKYIKTLVVTSNSPKLQI